VVAQDDGDSGAITVESRFHPECRGAILTSEGLNER
jgi:hypothetical protein